MIGTVSGGEHHEVFDLVATDKSLDSMGKWTQFDTGKDGGPIPILEDRLQENWAPNDWIDRGREYFEKTRALLEG